MTLIADLTLNPPVMRHTLNGLALAGLSYPISSRCGPASWLVTRTRGQVRREDPMWHRVPPPDFPDMPAQVEVTIAKDYAQIPHFTSQTADALARRYMPGARLVATSTTRGGTGSMIDVRTYRVPAPDAARAGQGGAPA